MKLKADFINDWIQNLKQELISNGYEISSISEKNIATCYFNTLERKPELRKRRIILSDVFECPAASQSAWDGLRNKIFTGEDLSSELSKNVAKHLGHDSLLNDWNVHHFQLETDVISIEPTLLNSSPLVLALVTRDAVYVINIYGYGTWDENEVVEIIHRNWPFIIERSKIGESISSKLIIKTLHETGNHQLNPFVTTEDDTIYSYRGGGYVDGGCDSIAGIRTNKTIDFLKAVEEILGKYLKSIVRQIPNYSGELDIEAKYIFEDIGGHIYFPQYDYRGVIDPKKWKNLMK